MDHSELSDRIGDAVKLVDALVLHAGHSQFNDQDLIHKLEDLHGSLKEFQDCAARLHEQNLRLTKAQGSHCESLGNHDATLLAAHRLQLVGTMSVGIAHDISNLLSPILLAIEPLRLKLTDEDSQSFLAMLKLSAVHGVSLVRQIVSFARGDEGSRKPVNPQLLVTEVVGFARTLFPKSIEVDSPQEGNLWTLTGNFSQLLQVLLNLCINARDAMPKGGRLTLKAENVQLDGSRFGKLGPFVLITVSDTGEGIRDDLVDNSFRLFATTKGVGGSGVGLATAKRIIEDHGGFIEVESGIGIGTQMRVYIPASESRTVETTFASPDLPVGRGELVLVIDDELAVLVATKKMLEAFGYRVLMARSGVEARTICEQNKSEIRVVLVDLMMPNENGVETIIDLRKAHPRVRVIVATGLDSKDELVEAAKKGLIETFLWKPFTAASLLQVLSAVLSADR